MYDICCEKKFKMSSTNVGAKTARKQFVKNTIMDHQTLALQTLLTEEKVGLLQISSQCTSSVEDLTKTGIVQQSHDGKLHFIHRTFAEYYVAEFFVIQLTKGSNISQQVLDLLLQKIFVGGNYRVVRAFIDEFFSRSAPSEDVLKQCGNRIHELRRDCVPILHQAAREGNAYVVGFLLHSVQAGEHTDTVNELLLAQDDGRHTALHLAAMGGHTKVLEKIWEWAKEKLKTEELVNKLLLAKDSGEKTAWHLAAEEGNPQVLQKLWEWGKETLKQRS
jgi:hypothetical protein